LAFDPPLIERAVGDNNGFAHHWEKLNYAFARPNPAKFPKLKTLADDDREVLRRYVYGVAPLRVCMPTVGRLLSA
jgi:hypothetical protein